MFPIIEEFKKSANNLMAVKEGIALASVCSIDSVEMLNNSRLNASRLRHIGGRDRPMNTMELCFRIPVPVGLTGFQLIGIMANSSLTKVGSRIRSSLRQHGLEHDVFVYGLTAEVNMTGATPVDPWLFPPVATRLSASGVDSGGSGVEVTTFTTTSGGFGGLKAKFANDPYDPDIDDPIEDSDPTTTVLQSMWGTSPIPADQAPQEQQLVKGTLQFLSSDAEKVVERREAHDVVRKELATAAEIAVDDVTARFGYTLGTSALEIESLQGVRMLRTPGYVDCEYVISIEPNHTAEGILRGLTARHHGLMARHMETGFAEVGLMSMEINITGFTHEISQMELIGPAAPNLPKANAAGANRTHRNQTTASSSNETNLVAIPTSTTIDVPTSTTNDVGSPMMDDSNSSNTSAELEDRIVTVGSVLPSEFPHAKSTTRPCSVIILFAILPMIVAH